MRLISYRYCHFMFIFFSFPVLNLLSQPDLVMIHDFFSISANSITTELLQRACKFSLHACI